MTNRARKLFLERGKKGAVWVKMFEMLRYQEQKVAVTVAWILAPLAFMLGSFYIATVFYTARSVETFQRDGIDLQPQKVLACVPYGLAGLALGVLFALVVTVVYPKYVDREYRAEAEHHH